MSDDLVLFEHVVIENVTRKTLFLFHGTGGTKNDFLFLNELLGSKYTLVGLMGNVDESGMKRFFKRHAEGVFDVESIQTESAKLDRFITTWTKKHYLNREDMVFLGYSNGANILLSTLFLFPSHFQHMALLHPMLPLEPQPDLDISGKKLFVSYGAGDTMADPKESMRVIDALTEHGAEVASHEYPGGHGISNPEIDDVVTFLVDAVQ